MKAMLKIIAKSLEIDVGSPFSKFEKQFKKKTLVLVLDEIDMMSRQHGGIAEIMFRTLMDWAEDKQMHFSMIGIYNCVNEAVTKHVMGMGNVSHWQWFTLPPHLLLKQR